MFKVYYTDPATDIPHVTNAEHINDALNEVESLRSAGMTYVTLVTNYVTGVPPIITAENLQLPPVA